MKLLITGGTGFLGRHLVWRAAKEGATVIFTGRNAKAAQQVIDLSAGTVSWQPLQHGSLEALQLLKTAARSADAIIHCAALSSPWGNKEAFQKANIDSTREVLRAGHDNGVRRLLHISTPSLYFGFQDRLDIHENDALPPPVNEYARSKKIAENLVQDNPLAETVILRPRALFGPWDMTLVPRLLRVMQRGSIPLMRGGDISLDLTYIDNAVDAIWLALSQPLPRALAIYNISNGEPQRLKDLLEIMAREFQIPLHTRRVPWKLVKLLAWILEMQARINNGTEPLMTRYSAGVLAFSQTLNIDALRNELGYHPQINIEEGIKRHASWWRQQQQAGLS